jgi:TRAP-type C4-dicarboxylate transport system permease small subunit
MDVSLSSWLVILLAVLAANLPFLNERVFGRDALAQRVKPFWLRLLEMFASLRCLLA